MKLCTVRGGSGRTSAARVDGDHAVMLPYADVGAMLADEHWLERAAPHGERVPFPHADLAPVVPHPNKIICLGLNYASHIAEMGRPTPAYPTLFAKFDGSLIGPYDDIRSPAVSNQVDWEAELGIVVGRAARHVSPEDALAHVAGYTVVNDVTIRDWQHRTRQFLSGKTFESTTPVGPVLVTADELPAGASGLEISCSVDGNVVQKSNTADLLFGAASIISYISDIITLRPGDLIATGTPGGVGAGRDPQVFLRPGQELTTVVEAIGELRNVVVEDRPPVRRG